MSGITKSDLVRFANSPDAELRLRTDAANVVGIQEATWHGRLARFLKVTFGGDHWSDKRNDSRTEYAKVEKAVYGALESAYGVTIAKSAFRSVVDHDAGVEQTHSDYPLTSRQVRQMVKLAEREIGREPEGLIRQPERLTRADLEALALTGDSELRRSEGGGLIARKGPEQTGYETDYRGAKQAVLRALTNAYGSTVAHQAFAHGNGRLNANGEVESSRDEPLRGSQIRKMLDYAEVFVSRFETRDLQVRDPRQRDVSTRDLPNVIDARMTDAATLEWIECIQEGQETPEARQWQARREMLDGAQGNQGLFHGDIRSSKFNATYRDNPFAAAWPPVAVVRGQPMGFAGVSQITQDLMAVRKEWLDTDVDRHAYWTLDLGLTKAFRDGDARQRIAIHVDREDPDTIHVFDANRREARVPRAMFDGWLAAHLSQVYGDDIKHLSLHRMQPQYLGLYEDKGKTYQCDRTMELADHPKYEREFIRQLDRGLAKNAETLVDRDGLRLCKAFHDDMVRTDSRVIIDGEMISLTEENAPSMLQELVTSGDDEADKIAAKGLSILLNQALLNAVGFMVDVVGVGDGNAMTRAQDQDAKQLEARRVTDEDGREFIDITCRTRSAIAQLDIEDADISVDRNKNTLTAECTIRVALDELRLEGGHQKYTVIQPPRCSLHLESPKIPGEDKIDEVDIQPEWQKHISFSAHDDQMVAQLPKKRLEVIAVDRERLSNAQIGVLQQDLAVSDAARQQLSRLTQPGTFLSLYQMIGQDVTGAMPPLPPDDQVNISSKLSKDGTAVDVEFRYRMPEGFPDDDTVFHSFGFDAPHRDGKFDLTLRVRIPVAELEAGRPENFVLTGGPYIQQHGLSFGSGIGADVNKGATYDWMRRVDAGQKPLTGAEWRADHERLLRITSEGQGADKAFGDTRFVTQSESVTRGDPSADPQAVTTIAEGLLDDVLRRFAEEPPPDRAFWTLDLDLKDDFHDGGQSQMIGLHVDRNDPDVIHVFDANHSEIRVPRDQFSDWLNAHVTTVYGDKIAELSLHRMQQTLAGLYEARDGRWLYDAQGQFDETMQTDFKHRATMLLDSASSKMEAQLDGTKLASVFVQDVDRNEIIIVSEDESPLRLNKENAVPLLTDLVSTGDVELDRIAAQQLSILLGQSVLNAMAMIAMQSAGGEDSIVQSGGKGEITDLELRRVDVDGNSMIDITYRGMKNLIFAQMPEVGGFGLDPRTDSLKFGCTVRIPLESLQRDGGYQDYIMLQQPQYHLRLEREKIPGQNSSPDIQDNIDRGQSHITFCPYGARLIASSGIKELEEQIRECGSRMPNVGVQLERQPPDDLQLLQGPRDQLARLMDPQIFAPVYQRIAGHNTNGGDVEVPPNEQIKINAVRSYSQGEPMIDVEYRYPMPDGFPNDATALHFWDDVPEGDARFEVTLRIRIPVEELEHGRPENFVVVGGPHIERQPLD